ncbi:2-haloalkanoic acid dehalogenase, type II [Burkholderiales bacterium JOSHI_001]|nr:2-haloalkanoic acid dehalogenase, type II [Burkholderiales bacterium JOSHI_001]
MPVPAAIRALIFDVFGTLVDWRGGVARDAQAALAPLGLACDWLGFADDWRAQYQPAMAEVRSGRIPFCTLDLLHRRNLDVVLRARGWDAAVDETTRAALNRAWHRLDAWPDVGPGLAALRQRFLLAPCSNGHIALMVALARRNGWHWDAVLGAEIARDYKPQPVVYRTAAAALGCAPHEVLMVAAHTDDLLAAAAAGLRTAHVARPDEKGPGLGEAGPAAAVDWAAADLPELAAQLAP